MSDFLDLSKYTKLSQIGKGAFGVVFKISEKGTDEIFAAKISLLELTEDQKRLITNLYREVNIISHLNHPSILKFIGYSPTDFANQPFPVIVTEYSSNGSLGTILQLERQSLSPPSWNDTKKLINIYGIASAMSYLHSHDIIHRDLKPDNILEDEYLFPKIADFGLSKVLNSNADSTDQSTIGFKGTPIYVAPESWETNEYTKEGDVYAFSIIVYELLTLDQPFKDFSMMMMCKKVAIDGIRPEFKFKIADCYKNLITKCWSQYPNDRPTFSEIVEELRTNEDFLIGTIDRDEFYDYVDLLDNLGSSFNPHKKFEKIIISQNKIQISEYNEKFNELPNDIKMKIKEIVNDKIIKEKTVTFSFEKTKFFYEKKFFDSEKFINFLNYFELIKFDVDDKYRNIKELFIKLKSIKEKNNNLEVNIIHSNLKLIPFFEDCKIKYSILFPSRIQKVPSCAFKGSSSLIQITFNHPIELIGNQAFSECFSLRKIKIPNTVKDIGNYAFKKCSSLFEITIPSSVKSIRPFAFEDCSSLEIVNFDSPSSVSLIGNSCFSGCSSLKKISIPSSVTEIRPFVFKGCKMLDQISFEIPSSVTEICSSTFCECSSLKKISIPSSVKLIGDSAFKDCLNLIEIEIDSSVSSFGNSCFCGCSNLIEISIPNSVESIGDDVFKGCLKLTNVSLPDSLKSIGNGAFDGCLNLTEISIPNSVESIGDDAFKGCLKLTNVSLPDSLKSIENGVFDGCLNLLKISIPKSVVSIGNKAFCGCSCLTEISIPDKVESIGESCFFGCSSLSKIVMPDSHDSSLASIGNCAFKGCSSLLQLFVPSSVKSIGDAAFSECKSLKDLSLPSSFKKPFIRITLGIGLLVKIKYV